MLLDIYRPTNSSKIFIFVAAGVVPESVLPNEIKEKLGQITPFKLRKEINLGDPTIGASPEKVISNVNANGFYIQGVDIKTKTNISEAGAALGAGLLLTSIGGGPIGAIVGAGIGLLLAKKANKDDTAREAENDS